MPERTLPLTRRVFVYGLGLPPTLLTMLPLELDTSSITTTQSCGTINTIEPDAAMARTLTSRCWTLASVKSSLIEPDEHSAMISAGTSQRLVRLLPEQHFTQPPPRYTEARLVRTLEEYGIGRPSTYAPILGTLQQRGYVVRDGKRLTPTETGGLVSDLVTEHFPEILDVGFTARMEEDLDRISEGEESWVDVIREFYTPLPPR